MQAAAEWGYRLRSPALRRLSEFATGAILGAAAEVCTGVELGGGRAPAAGTAYAFMARWVAVRGVAGGRGPIHSLLRFSDEAFAMRRDRSLLLANCQISDPVAAHAASMRRTG